MATPSAWDALKTKLGMTDDQTQHMSDKAAKIYGEMSLDEKRVADASSAILEALTSNGLSGDEALLCLSLLLGSLAKPQARMLLDVNAVIIRRVKKMDGAQ